MVHLFPEILTRPPIEQKPALMTPCWDAIAALLKTYSAMECNKYLANCGYRAV